MKKTTSRAADGLTLAGLAVVVFGLYLWSRPLAAIVTGAMLVVIGIGSRR
jgi:hypothetical protein